MRIFGSALLLLCGAATAAAHDELFVPSALKALLKSSVQGDEDDDNRDDSPRRSDMTCVPCSDKDALLSFRQELIDRSAQWDKFVKDTPYGMAVMRWGNDKDARHKKRPEMPRWVVMSAKHNVHSTNIYTRTDKGDELFEHDDESGMNMEAMYWLATMGAQCIDPTLTICAKFADTPTDESDSDTTLTHTHTPLPPSALAAAHFYVGGKGWVLTCDVDKVVVGDAVCTKMCTMEYSPVCGSNNETYSNMCFFDIAKCRSINELTVLHDGECDGKKKSNEAFLA